MWDSSRTDNTEQEKKRLTTKDTKKNHLVTLSFVLFVLFVLFVVLFLRSFPLLGSERSRIVW